MFRFQESGGFSKLDFRFNLTSEGFLAGEKIGEN